MLSQIQNDLILIVSGFQETMISIAAHVNQSVQKVKIDRKTTELEKEIRENQAQIGKLVYENPQLSIEEVKAGFVHLPEIKALIERTGTSQKSLDAISGTVSPQEALNDFERLLMRSDFVIQHVRIVEGFSGIGKTIRELDLPINMLIFFIKKNSRIEIAGGGILLEAKDEVTFLCSKENRHKYIEFWS